MKEQKGITLIALVITIIVLLILAGVSIAMLTGQNGILTKAGEATTKTSSAEAEEAVKLGLATILANKYDPTYEGTLKTVTGANIVTAITNDNSSAVVSTKEGTKSVTTDGETTTITYIEVSYKTDSKKKDTEFVYVDANAGKIVEKPADVTFAE